MYALEEYLAAVVLAIVLAFAGTAIVLAVLLTLHKEDSLFDGAFATDSFALPPLWPRLWVLMTIVERWQRLSVSSHQKVKRVLRRLHMGLRANIQWKTFSGRIVKEIFTRAHAGKDRIGRLMP